MSSATPRELALLILRQLPSLYNAINHETRVEYPKEFLLDSFNTSVNEQDAHAGVVSTTISDDHYIYVLHILKVVMRDEACLLLKSSQLNSQTTGYVGFALNMSMPTFLLDIN